MSLASEPVLSKLQSQFVCGTKDITNEPYCGRSGRHQPDGKAIKTTNGAGPHNLQLFVLAPDGTVLHCLPGYWAPNDLVHELELGQELYHVWKNPTLSRSQKNQMFSQMQLAHYRQHPPDMSRRSNMQGFDQKFEARRRPYQSDTVKNPQLAIQALQSNDNKLLRQAFKTTDQILHERMAQRPFVPYGQFDVAAYSDYGRQKYDKNEDLRDESGRLPMKNAMKNSNKGVKNYRNRLMTLMQNRG